MARTTASPRRNRNKKPKTALGRFFAALFCKRSIIIISDHKTQHVPFAAGTQVFMTVAAMGFVAWAAFSSGSYMAAQKVIDEKEKKLATFAEENERVSAEFTLLRQDLMKLADGGKGNKTAEAAKEIAEQYADKPQVVASADGEDASKYDVVFKRIQFLENKVKELQTDHDTMISDIRATTGGKIKELEKVIARTGMDKEELQRAADAKRIQDEQRRERYGRTETNSSNTGDDEGGQGGPYIPISTNVLKQKDAELYFNLRKVTALNDVVTAMPLALPMGTDDYHLSSGFGMRIDPFRGTLAMHAGLDIAGVSGAKIVAANDGRVEFAGWKTAYGNVIDVKHEYGFSTRYGHLRQILVRPGQLVKKGQVIGIQGSTGRSTGEHLHYEVRYDDKPINPANFLKAGEEYKAGEDAQAVD